MQAVHPLGAENRFEPMFATVLALGTILGFVWFCSQPLKDRPPTGHAPGKPRPPRPKVGRSLPARKTVRVVETARTDPGRWTAKPVHVALCPAGRGAFGEARSKTSRELSSAHKTIPCKSGVQVSVLNFTAPLESRRFHLMSDPAFDSIIARRPVLLCRRLGDEHHKEKLERNRGPRSA